jgi:hypothetical protein
MSARVIIKHCRGGNMKCFLVLSVLVLAALGAPGPEPASCPLPFADYVWLDSLYGPPDTIHTDSLLAVWGAAMLHSADQESLTIEVQVKSWSGFWSVTTSTYKLAPGDSTPVEWGIGGIYESKYYVVRESIVDSMPTDSSFVTWRFWVVYGAGGVVEEGQKQPAASRELRPTAVSHLAPGAVAFDAMGRRVLNPKPGIYFMRAAAAAQPRKVLLVE